jgi:hypothetical protein
MVACQSYTSYYCTGKQTTSSSYRHEICCIYPWYKDSNRQSILGSTIPEIFYIALSLWGSSHKMNAACVLIPMYVACFRIPCVPSSVNNKCLPCSFTNERRNISATMAFSYALRHKDTQDCSIYTGSIATHNHASLCPNLDLCFVYYRYMQISSATVVVDLHWTDFCTQYQIARHGFAEQKMVLWLSLYF